MYLPINKKLFCAMLLVSISCHLFSQDLKIVYNCVTKKTTYISKSGKVFTDSIQPKLKKGDNINVVVEDINPFVYYAVIEQTDSSVSSPLSVMTNVASSLNSTGVAKFLPGGIGSMLGSLDDGASRSVPSTYGLKGTELRNAVRQNRLRNILEGHRYKMLLSIDTEVRAINSDVVLIDNFNDTLCSYNHAINAAMRCPDCSRASIIKKVDSLELKILREPDFKGDSLKQKLSNNYNKLMEDYYKYTAYLNIYANTTAQLKYDFTKMDSDLISDIDSSMESVSFEVTRQKHLYNIQTNLDSLTSWATMISAIIKRNSSPTVSPMVDELVQKRTELYAKDFTYSKSNIIVRKDFKNINILIYDSLDKEKPETLVDVKRLSLMAGHPLYSLPSVGVTFSRMFQQQYTYQNRNSIIAATKGSPVTPSLDVQFTLATPGNSKYFAYGGTVGVGYSITDESLDFMLGPSILVGGKQKIMITAGILAGEVTKLSQGAKVGETLSASDSVVPTSKVYSVGYFLGLSYVPRF